MGNREIWLAATLVELTDARSDVDDVDYANELAVRLAELLIPAEIGVLIDAGGGQLTVAGASTERLRTLVSVEARHGEGPCTASYRTGQGLINLPLGAADDRWPRYAPAARSSGFGMVTTLVLRRHDDVVGGVSVLDAGDHVLTEQDAHLAQLMADVATVAVLNRRALRDSTRTAGQLQHALHSRVLIEQAKGVVAARVNVKPDAAFELLRGYARRHNRKLIEVAGDTVAGVLPTAELTATRRNRQPG